MTATTAHESMILKAHGLKKSFGGFQAVDVDELMVREGSITALIGPNGAGKTTLFDLLSGFLKPDEGSIVFKDSNIENIAAHKRSQLGLVRTFQLTRMFDELDPIENLLVGKLPKERTGLFQSLILPWRSRKFLQEDLEQAHEILELVGLSHVAHLPTGNLSGGQRKLVEFARVLMTNPEVLLLDEPFAGVNPAIREDMLRLIRGFAAKGGTVLLVEHDLPRVMQVAETVVVLDRGKVIAVGSPAEVTSDEKVINAYIGKRRSS